LCCSRQQSNSRVPKIVPACGAKEGPAGLGRRGQVLGVRKGEGSPPATQAIRGAGHGSRERHEKFRLCPFSNGVRQQGNSCRPQTKGPAADGARFLPLGFWIAEEAASFRLPNQFGARGCVPIRVSGISPISSPDHNKPSDATNTAVSMKGRCVIGTDQDKDVEPSRGQGAGQHAGDDRRSMCQM
jgi:hypothetical protein